MVTQQIGRPRRRASARAQALVYALLTLGALMGQMTVTVGLLSFIGQYGTQWDLLLPALVIVILPTVLVFIVAIVASRRVIRGFTAGAVRT